MKTQRETQLLNQIKNDLNQKMFDQAVNKIKEVLLINPENPTAYLFLADIANQKGQVSQGIKYLKKVLTLEPENTDAAIALSILYNDIGQYQKAQKLFEQIDSRLHHSSTETLKKDSYINHQFALKHFELAELYLTYERPEEALFEYKKSLKLAPNLYEARVQIGKIYSKQGLMAKAFQELRSLKNECPSYLPGRLALGILYYGNGNIIEAQNEWQKVLSKDPDNKEAQMYMGFSKQANETRLDYL